MTLINEKLKVRVPEIFPKISAEWKAGLRGGLIMSTLLAYPAALALNSIVTYCKEFLK